MLLAGAIVLELAAGRCAAWQRITAAACSAARRNVREASTQRARGQSAQLACAWRQASVLARGVQLQPLVFGRAARCAAGGARRSMTRWIRATFCGRRRCPARARAKEGPSVCHARTVFVPARSPRMSLKTRRTPRFAVIGPDARGTGLTRAFHAWVAAGQAAARTHQAPAHFQPPCRRSDAMSAPGPGGHAGRGPRAGGRSGAAPPRSG